MIEDNQLKRAAEIFQTACKAPYYKQKYSGYKIPSSWEEWRKIPVLERTELYDNTYPRTTTMFTGVLEDAIVSSTGGSSGVARTIVLRQSEWNDFCQKQAEAFMRLGVSKDDIVANMFVAGHLWPSFIGAHEMIMRSGCVHLPISANIGIDEAYKLCREYKPTVILSLPTFFVLMADIAKKDNKPFEGLRMACYAGEQMSREAEAHVRRWLGVKEIKPLAYTSGDCGIMGYQCADCGFGEYHTLTDFQLIEIVNPVTMEPVGPGETGEILVTSLRREFHPIIRYRIGDLASWIDDTCACGSADRKYRLAGRAGEDFKLGGAYVTVGEFERAVSEVEELSLNFQIELADVAGARMDLVVNVECDEPEKHADAAHRLEEVLAQHIQDIAGGLKIGFFNRYEVCLVPLGSLPRNPITGKIKKVIDHRVD